MVNLLPESNVDRNQYPNTHRWDQLVRKHHRDYQELIDAQTYRLQRIQRGFLVKYLLSSHFLIPNFIIPNFSLFNFSRRNRKLEKLIKIKSIFTKISILVLLLISTEPSMPVGISQSMDLELEDFFLHILHTFDAVCQLVLS